MGDGDVKGVPPVRAEKKLARRDRVERVVARPRDNALLNDRIALLASHAFLGLRVFFSVILGYSRLSSVILGDE